MPSTCPTTEGLCSSSERVVFPPFHAYWHDSKLTKRQRCEQPSCDILPADCQRRHQGPRSRGSHRKGYSDRLRETCRELDLDVPSRLVFMMDRGSGRVSPYDHSPKHIGHRNSPPADASVSSTARPAVASSFVFSLVLTGEPTS